MTSKEKITAILKAYTQKHNISASSVILEEYAEELLANGVIVPPCKVGDMVYFIIDDEISGKAYIDSQRINDVSTRGIFVSTSTLEENCDSFEPYSDFGKTVFLTKEEAEQALKEKGNG